MDLHINSLYLCVNDMDRAIKFYEELFEQEVTERDELYSVFEVNGLDYSLINLLTKLTNSEATAYRVSALTTSNFLMSSLGEKTSASR